MEKKKELPNWKDYWFYVLKGRSYTKYLEDQDNKVNKNASVSPNFNERDWEKKLLKFNEKNNIKTIINFGIQDTDDNNNDNEG